MENRVKTLLEIEKLVLRGEKQTIALAAAHSEEALAAVEYARSRGVVEAVLVGDEQLIRKYADANKIEISNYRIIDEPSAARAAEIAVCLVRSQEAHLLMKGQIETSDFLRAVLNKEKGLRSEKRLCSAVVIESKRLKRLIILADVGTNIAPDLETKASIIESCSLVARAMGIESPKAAVLCAHEKVKPEAMPITAEAAILSKMSKRGQIKGGAIVEGPISMDIAVDRHAALVKNFQGDIQGDADIIITPDLEAGNILIKGLMYLTNDISIAGVGLGAKVPLILTSRGDDRDTKYYSIVLSALISQSKVMEEGV